MLVKIDWASLIVGSKFTVFALFYFVLEGNFPSKSPRGGLYLEGLMQGEAYFRILWYVSKGCQNGHVVQWPMSPLQLNSPSHGTTTPSWRT